MIITLQNEFLTAKVNTLGGAIESLMENGTEHIWPYDAERWPRRTSICFPVCSSLREGAYFYEGVKYEMPMHGFLREYDMQVVSQEKSRAVFAFEANEETRKIYPFDFRFELEQSLEGRSLVIAYRVINTGEKDLLFSVGSHYALLLPDREERCTLQFTKPQHAHILDFAGGVVTGRGEDFFLGRTDLPVKDQFESRSLIFEQAELDTESISVAMDGKPFTRMSCEGFPYLVLWAQKGGCPFVCIENWAGMADFAECGRELKEKRGIETAKPGQTRVFVQRISV